MELSGIRTPLVMQAPAMLQASRLTAVPPADTGETPGFLALGGSLLLQSPERSDPSMELSGDEFADAMLAKLNPSEDSESSRNTVNATNLANSMGDTMEWLRQEFGGDMAQSAMSLMASRIDNPEGMTEESFSRGLLETIRLVDEQHGFAAGDRVMAHFNGSLNNAINTYFDNGLSETFFATSPQAAGPGQPRVAYGVATDALEKGGESLMQAIQDQLDAMLDAANETTGNSDLPSSPPASATAAYAASSTHGARPESAGLDLAV